MQEASRRRWPANREPTMAAKEVRSQNTEYKTPKILPHLRIKVLITRKDFKFALFAYSGSWILTPDSCPLT